MKGRVLLVRLLKPLLKRIGTFVGAVMICGMVALPIRGQSASFVNVAYANLTGTPTAMAVDPSGDIFATVGNAIERVTPDGSVTVFAGSISTTGFADGQGAAARFNAPGAITSDASGSIYVCDAGNNAIRKVNALGSVTTIAVSLTGSAAITVDPMDNVYVATLSVVVYKISSGGLVSLIQNGPIGTTLTLPAASVAVDATGIPYVSEVTYTQYNGHSNPDQILTSIVNAATGATVFSWQTGHSYGLPGVLTYGYDGFLQYAFGSLYVTNQSDSFDGFITSISSGTSFPINSIVHPNVIYTADTNGRVFWAYSGAITMVASIGNVPIISTQPASITTTYANGAVTPVTLSVAAASLFPITYQWFLNGTVIPGATSATYNAALPGSYTVQVATSAGKVTSRAALVTALTAAGVNVTSSPTIVAQPVNANAIYNNGIVTGAQLSVAALSTSSLSYQWYLNGIAIVGATFSTFSATSPGSYTVVVSTSAGGVTSQAATVTVLTASGVPVLATPTILTQPQSAAAVFGAASQLPVLAVSAVSLQPLSYQWYLNGTVIPGATSASYQSAAVGSYTVVVTSGGTSVTSAPALVTLANRLANISGRCQVGIGANIGIAGFVISSYSGVPKQVLIRGIGPSLGQFGLTGILAQPVLSVFNSSGALLATNSGWAGSSAIAAAASSAGAFPLLAGSLDAALILNLPPGSYTAQVSGANNSTGIALVEVYEVGADASQLANISERAAVGTGGGILIGGFVAAGSQASKVLIRAAGPSLAQFGLSGTLAQPVLTIYDNSGNLIAINNGWSSSPEAVAISSAAGAAGAFPFQPGSGDCAVLMSLSPGPYTAEVTGVNGSNGVALIEVYQVGP